MLNLLFNGYPQSMTITLAITQKQCQVPALFKSLEVRTLESRWEMQVQFLL